MCRISSVKISALSAIAGLALVMAMSGGCSTPASNAAESAPVVVSVSSSGRLAVKGKSVPLKSLNRTLRAAGARTKTPIHVSLSPGTPDARVAEISRTLASGKFPRVVFIRPKKPSASGKGL